MPAKKPAAKTFMDVSHPNRTAPTLTSKPVIVTNRPIMKDPMMSDSGSKSEPSVSKIEVNSKTSMKPKLQPLAAPVEEVTEAADVTEKPVVTAKEEENPEVIEVAETEKEKEQEQEPKLPTEPENRSDDTIRDPSKDQEEEEKKLAEEAAAIQKLIDEKQYFLPINSLEKRRTKRVVAVGILLSVILAAAWFNIALDAGLLQIEGVKPVTHFFSS